MSTEYRAAPVPIMTPQIYLSQPDNHLITEHLAELLGFFQNILSIKTYALKYCNLNEEAPYNFEQFSQLWKLSLDKFSETFSHHPELRSIDGILKEEFYYQKDFYSSFFEDPEELSLDIINVYREYFLKNRLEIENQFKACLIKLNNIAKIPLHNLRSIINLLPNPKSVAIVLLNVLPRPIINFIEANSSETSIGFSLSLNNFPNNIEIN